MIDTVKESGIDHDVNQNYDDDLLVPMVSTNTSSDKETEITIEKKNFIFIYIVMMTRGQKLEGNPKTLVGAEKFSIS